MKPSEKNSPFVNQLRQALDQIPVDTATRQRLDHMRRSALAPAPKHHWLRHALPAAAFASISAVVISLLLMKNPPQAPAMSVDNIDAFEIISNRDELEMYQNLEFYLWLEAQPESSLG